MKQRIANLIKRLAAGETLYTNESPRISRAEIAEIQTIVGVLLQTEHIYGAEPGPIAVYPIDQEAFRKKAAFQNLANR